MCHFKPGRKRCFFALSSQYCLQKQAVFCSNYRSIFQTFDNSGRTMHHTTLIEGEYVHNSMGFNLSESNHIPELLIAMIDWVRNRPNANHSQESIIEQSTGDTLIKVIDVRRYHGKVDCIDLQYFDDRYRIFLNEVPGHYRPISVPYYVARIG
jgi:hypothetical protein